MSKARRFSSESDATKTDGGSQAENQRRLDKNDLRGLERPMITASNVHYDLAERSSATACGGLGSMHLLAERLGLASAIDRRLSLFKVHLPYHESDHVLSLAYNTLCGGAGLPGGVPWHHAAVGYRR